MHVLHGPCECYGSSKEQPCQPWQQTGTMYTGIDRLKVHLLSSYLLSVIENEGVC